MPHKKHITFTYQCYHISHDVHTCILTLWLIVLLETLQEMSDQASTVIGRRRLLAVFNATIPSNHIPNPVLCVQAGEMVIFKISINDTDRSQSNYPKYNKDHLFSTNPTFDFGAFTALQYQVENTNANISNFIHVFTDGGNYVFYDAQDPTM